MDILSVIGVVLTIVSLLLLVPVTVLVVQVLASLWPARTGSPAGAVRPRLAVLMPAHNESAGIAAALATVVSQLGEGDRVLVVADNCSDDTAGVAAAAGGEVIVREDRVRRGKGYALDFGVRHLAADPPEVLVIVDADCAVGPDALDRLARRCRESGRPVQALYLMRSPPQAGLKTRIAEFAWTVRNHARPLGFARLGLPCQLMGTGMAFPWALISAAPLASGHLVEDLQLGLDLASAGAAPLFCPEALVTSSFPSQTEGMTAQRTRWEHGHLSVIASVGPRLIWRAVTRGQASLAAMALDLCVPPLASLVLMHLVWLVASGAWAAFGAGSTALLVTVCSLLLLSGGVMLAWWRYARHIVSLTELLGAPAYVISKIPVYAKLFGKRQMEWVRTKRDDKSN
jgi:cellulose synthase/poly-beta-1,6-N-acetylglucosamine synthase-like glycosyltransferase